MKRSRHLKDTYERRTRKEYLEGVKSRLVNDVGTYFATIDTEASKRNYIGFWGSARLIFPVIEAVADTIYRKDGKERLLKELNIEYPEIVWQMYRNSLAHSDRLIHIKKGNKTIIWSVTASAGGIMIGHIFKGNTVHIDTRRLYEDFLSFLDKEIAISTTSIYDKNGLAVGRKYQGELGPEIDRFPS